MVCGGTDAANHERRLADLGTTSPTRAGGGDGKRERRMSTIELWVHENNGKTGKKKVLLESWNKVVHTVESKAKLELEPNPCVQECERVIVRTTAHVMFLKSRCIRKARQLCLALRCVAASLRSDALSLTVITM